MLPHMKIPYGKVAVVVLLLAVALLGAFGIKSWGHQRREEAEQGTALRNHIERAGLFAEALDLLDAGRPEDARVLLRAQFERSLRRADEIIALGAKPYDPDGRLGGPLDRARRTAERMEIGPEGIERAGRVIDAWRRGQR